MSEKNIWLGLAENVRVETARLILRPVALSDAEDMYDYAHDAEMAKYVFHPHESIEETKLVISELMMKNPLGNFGIELKVSGKFIGTISFTKLNVFERTAEVGYSIGKNYWNQGYASEALEKVLEVGFVGCELKEIRAQFDEENIYSGRVMAHAGMAHGGTYRRFDRVSKEIRNFVEYTMKNYEWFKR
jgi:RimJ/RimL family protein N-acetyltransferase